MRHIFSFLILITLSTSAFAAIDTLYVSDKYTTHIIFGTDILYAGISDFNVVNGRIVEESKNKISIKAHQPFDGNISLSAEEANGAFHTYILKYKANPKSIVIDRRPGKKNTIIKLDTISISRHYITHILFATDIIYADISAPAYIAAKIVEQGKNKLALLAKNDFGERTLSVSVEEANGIFHTYIINYEDQPASLVFDTKQKTQKADSGHQTSIIKDSRIGANSNAFKRSDAPMLQDIFQKKQTLFHISTKNYGLRLTVENIFSYSDITYLTLRLDNESGVSYEVSDAIFIMETKSKSKKKIANESTLIPKNRYGTLASPAHSSSRISYSFEKLTLSRDHVLKIYLYEDGGQRNFSLTLSSQDINKAISPIETR